MRRENDRRAISLRLNHQPVDLQQAFRLMPAIAAQGATIVAMYDDTLVRIEQSDNGVAGQRAAAMRQLDDHLRQLAILRAAAMMSVLRRFCLSLDLAALL